MLSISRVSDVEAGIVPEEKPPISMLFVDFVATQVYVVLKVKAYNPAISHVLLSYTTNSGEGNVNFKALAV